MSGAAHVHVSSRNPEYKKSSLAAGLPAVPLFDGTTPATATASASALPPKPTATAAAAPKKSTAAASVANTSGVAAIQFHTAAGSGAGDGGPDCSPKHALEYFDSSTDIPIPGTGDTFRIYRGGKGPAVFVLIHGAGHTALSWALAASQLKKEYEVLAIDLRAHGFTQTSDESILSAEVLTTDIVNVINVVYPTTVPPLVLVGHSMGGALVARLANNKTLPIVGCCVVDVVEGTALAALPSMHAVIHSRPTHFRSLEAAIRWTVQTGVVKNLESARVSVPPQLRTIATANAAAASLAAAAAATAATATAATTTTATTTAPTPPLTAATGTGATAAPIVSTLSPIESMDEASDSDSSAAASPASGASASASRGGVTPASAYVWRTNLLSTEPYWKDWFVGLSKLFLSGRGAKMLLLAGTDRLDKELTVAQMQGKFQMVVLPAVGHTIQEDSPLATAGKLLVWAQRFGFGVTPAVGVGIGVAPPGSGGFNWQQKPQTQPVSGKLLRAPAAAAAAAAATTATATASAPATVKTINGAAPSHEFAHANVMPTVTTIPPAAKPANSNSNSKTQ